MNILISFSQNDVLTPCLHFFLASPLQKELQYKEEWELVRKAKRLAKWNAPQQQDRAIGTKLHVMAEPDGHHTTDPTDLNILLTTDFIAMEFSMAIMLMAKDTQKLMLYADKKFCLCSPFSKAYRISALDC